MLILTPNRWQTAPTGPVRVNQNHPLARGLVAFFYPQRGAQSWPDPASGKLWTLENTGIGTLDIRTNSAGLSMYRSGTAYGEGGSKLGARLEPDERLNITSVGELTVDWGFSLTDWSMNYSFFGPHIQSGSAADYAFRFGYNRGDFGLAAGVLMEFSPKVDGSAGWYRWLGPNVAPPLGVPQYTAYRYSGVTRAGNVYYNGAGTVQDDGVAPPVGDALTNAALTIGYHGVQEYTTSGASQTNFARVWNRLLTTDEIALARREPFALLEPVRARTFYLPVPSLLPGVAETLIHATSASATGAGSYSWGTQTGDPPVVTGPTRFYLPYKTSADTGGFAPSYTTGWDSTGSTVRTLMETAKTSTALTNVAITKSVTTNNYDILFRQYISEPLSWGVTVDGTVSGAIRGQVSANNNNAFIQQVIKLVDSSGGNERILYTLGTSTATNNSYEFTTGAAPRTIPAGAWGAGVEPPAYTLTSQTANAGDRIVVEVGMRMNTTSSGVSGTLAFGDNQASDIAIIANTGNFNPWVEFSVGVPLGARAYREIGIKTVVSVSAAGGKIETHSTTASLSHGTAVVATVASARSGTAQIVLGQPVQGGAFSSGFSAGFGSIAAQPAVEVTAIGDGSEGQNVVVTAQHQVVASVSPNPTIAAIIQHASAATAVVGTAVTAAVSVSAAQSVSATGFRQEIELHSGAATIGHAASAGAQVEPTARVAASLNHATLVTADGTAQEQVVGTAPAVGYSASVAAQVHPEPRVAATASHTQGTTALVATTRTSSALLDHGHVTAATPSTSEQVSRAALIQHTAPSAMALVATQVLSAAVSIAHSVQVAASISSTRSGTAQIVLGQIAQGGAFSPGFSSGFGSIAAQPATEVLATGVVSEGQSVVVSVQHAAPAVSATAATQAQVGATTSVLAHVSAAVATYVAIAISIDHGTDLFATGGAEESSAVSAAIAHGHAAVGTASKQVSESVTLNHANQVAAAVVHGAAVPVSVQSAAPSIAAIVAPQAQVSVVLGASSSISSGVSVHAAVAAGPVVLATGTAAQAGASEGQSTIIVLSNTTTASAVVQSETRSSGTVGAAADILAVPRKDAAIVVTVLGLSTGVSAASTRTATVAPVTAAGTPSVQTAVISGRVVTVGLTVSHSVAANATASEGQNAVVSVVHSRPSLSTTGTKQVTASTALSCTSAVAAQIRPDIRIQAIAAHSTSVDAASAGTETATAQATIAATSSVTAAGFPTEGQAATVTVTAQATVGAQIGKAVGATADLQHGTASAATGEAAITVSPIIAVAGSISTVAGRELFGEAALATTLSTGGSVTTSRTAPPLVIVGAGQSPSAVPATGFKTILRQITQEIVVDIGATAATARTVSAMSSASATTRSSAEVERFADTFIGIASIVDIVGVPLPPDLLVDPVPLLGSRTMAISLSASASTTVELAGFTGSSFQLTGTLG